MELTRPFAENGDRQDFPVNTQGDGTMSLQQGFGTFYGLPPEEGGLFIQRPQFNQLMYLVSKGVIDNKTAIETLKSQYGSLSTSSAKLLTKNLTWNVGSGGDFTDLQTAIDEASKYIPIGANKIKITIQQGYVIDKTIYSTIFTDTAFVEVTSNSVEINVEATGLTILDDSYSVFNKCNLCEFKGLKLKLINFDNSNIYYVFRDLNTRSYGCYFTDFTGLAIAGDAIYNYNTFNLNKNTTIKPYIFWGQSSKGLTVWGGTYELFDKEVVFLNSDFNSDCILKREPIVKNNNSSSILCSVRYNSTIYTETILDSNSTFNGTKLSQPKGQWTDQGYINGKIS